MLKIVSILLSLNIAILWAQERPKKFITIDEDAVKKAENTFGKDKFQVVQLQKNLALVEIDESIQEPLSDLMHEQFHRCGGFVEHQNYDEANYLITSNKQFIGMNLLFTDYAINQQSIVNQFLPKVTEIGIRKTINKLSGFYTRSYQSNLGMEASAWLANQWKELAKSRNDITVSLFHHRWRQPSVAAMIKGKGSKVVVVGGHVDSKNYSQSVDLAPGADDNASGIASFTEVFKALVEGGYQPENNILFVAYSAEEEGLKGSADFVAHVKELGWDISGVIQLDMTNFKGSTRNIYFMTDYTNTAQNEFLGALVDEYVKVPWGYDKCGYACSDHASWTNAGYPASMPFETEFGNYNKKIHTVDDTLTVSGNNANHALSFAKLALAFVVELDR